MRAHYLQHVPFEGLGSIAPWLAAAGYQTTCTRWFGETALPEPDAFPTEFEAFHWHGETFDLPPGAVRLARSAACANQAFQWGERVVGLQFHLETTPETARALVAHCPADLRPGPWGAAGRTVAGHAAGAVCRDPPPAGRAAGLLDPPLTSTRATCDPRAACRTLLK